MVVVKGWAAEAMGAVEKGSAAEARAEEAMEVVVTELVAEERG